MSDFRITDMRLPDALRERIAARILGVAVPGAVVAVGILAFGIPIFAPGQWTRLYPVGTALVIALGAHVLARSGQAYRGVNVLIWGLILAAGVGMVLHGGMHAPVSAIFIAIAVLIATMHGFRRTMLALLGIAVVNGGFVVADAWGWLPQHPPTNAAMLWLIYSVFSVVAALFALIPVALMVHALREREEQAAELERARQDERTRALQFAAVFDQSFQFMGLLDPAGTLLQANATSLRFVGVRAEDVIGKPFPETPWWSVEQRPQIIAAIRRAAGGERVAFQTTHRDDQGVVRIIDFSLSPFRDGAGKVVYLIPEGRDITAMTEAEAQLQQALKMDSLGQLAGGVAHDFNNMLAGIGMAVELLERGAGHGGEDRVEDRRAHLQVIRKAVERAGGLTQLLLQFARKTPPEQVTLDLHATIRTAIALLERSMEQRVRIEFIPAPGDPAIHGNAGHLENVFINLGLNARDAITGEGLLTITTSVVEFGPGNDQVGELHLPHGRHVAVAVRDTGAGMDDATRGRIFEPFFTTKGARGTGLGLSSVYGTVGDHGGAIRVESALGRGTCFTLYFPLIGTATAPEEEKSDSQVLPGLGRILLVDDEPTLRQMAAEVLELLGYSVVTAVGGRDALDRFTAEPEGYDLIIVDMSMPGMSGGDLCRAIRVSGSKVPLLIATGYASQDGLESLQALGDVRVMQKPFRINVLGRVVAAAIGSKVGVN